ncbi:hypothetical protein IC619_013900 [Hazenella sp. IB182353]|uniref:hypothetical protein n=1 Tax=Polycladospora coralii TaxID=2771432 RepID=UPI001745E0B7|nr:hypothetical protein [Polycladospora coralii]MBS7531577.1 hypothetical protein [Polycladospora coralii]
MLLLKLNQYVDSVDRSQIDVIFNSMYIEDEERFMLSVKLVNVIDFSIPRIFTTNSIANIIETKLHDIKSRQLESIRYEIEDYSGGEGLSGYCKDIKVTKVCKIEDDEKLILLWEEK